MNLDTMADRVREPIQVYLTASERAELDRTADDLDVSRSEALRRGVRALAAGSRATPAGPLAELVDAGLATAARLGPGPPPPRRPVATLAELLEELAADRGDR
jgi:hypothetical protein